MKTWVAGPLIRIVPPGAQSMVSEPPGRRTSTGLVDQPAADRGDRGRAGAGAAGPGQPGAALPDAQADRVALERGDVDVDPLGEERVVLDQRPEPGEIDRVGIADEEDDMRIADIDRARLLQILPADRHRRRVHRISERDLLPAEARRAHVDRRRRRRSGCRPWSRS